VANSKLGTKFSAIAMRCSEVLSCQVFACEDQNRANIVVDMGLKAESGNLDKKLLAEITC